MTSDADRPSVRLLHTLALVMDVGAEAESVVEPIAIPAASADENGVFRGVAAVWRRPTSAPPSADQVRRACARLDAFAKALADASDRIEDGRFVDVVSQASGWSTLLWDSAANAAQVYNEVRSAIATLARYRTNLILGRPIAAGDP